LIYFSHLNTFVLLFVFWQKSAAWVVLKLLKRHPSDPAKEEHTRTAYRAEVHLLKQLNHPQIVNLIDSFETKEHFVIVTQFLAGGQLYDYMGTHSHT
jgi:serine/threonine protein kinase